MPFDTTPAETPVQRRLRLIEALEAPMPLGFQWNYGHVSRQTPCGTTSGCALGLAYQIWPELKNSLPGLGPIFQSPEAFFGLSPLEADQIFWGYHPTWADLTMNQITPKMVAQALREVTPQTQATPQAEATPHE